jgi:hypothetical protein
MSTTGNIVFEEYIFEVNTEDWVYSSTYLINYYNDREC